MVRKPCFDKNGMKKGAWSAEEDNKLRAYIERYGYWNWRELPKYAGLSRCGKSCRLRWMNYLRPNVKRGNYSKEEEDIIIKLHEELGNKWSAIAAKLPGRSDNEIKNHWHTHLKKLVKQNPTTSEVKEQSHNIFPFESNQEEQSIKTSPCEANTKRESIPEDVVVNGLSQQTSEISLLSPEPSSSGFSSLSSINSELFRGTNWTAEDSFSSMETFAEPTGNFWSEPFLADTSYNQNDSSSFSLVEGGFIYPYISCYDDVNDLFYQLMDEIPMK